MALALVSLEMVSRISWGQTVGVVGEGVLDAEDGLPPLVEVVVLQVDALVEQPRTRRASPIIWCAVRMFLSISARSMSMWTTFALGGEGLGVAGDPVGEPAADGDQQVAFVAGGVGGMGAVHAHHAGNDGSRRSEAPPPMTVVATGAPTCSMNLRNSGTAFLLRMTPPPTRIRVFGLVQHLHQQVHVVVVRLRRAQVHPVGVPGQQGPPVYRSGGARSGAGAQSPPRWR